MINISFNIKQLEKDLGNIMGYSAGFIEGVDGGSQAFADALGTTAVEALNNFIDVSARMDPQMLHHVYEWYRTGSPEARLFHITYKASGNTISFSSKFSQSRSFQDGSNTPFWNKAEIMEYGKAVTVTPRGNSPLVFEDGGETIFTKAPVTIENPGGVAVQGSFREILDVFFSKYFSQSFLRSSGIISYIENPKAFKDNFRAGKEGGKSLGYKTGYNWISKAGEL